MEVVFVVVGFIIFCDLVWRYDRAKRIEKLKEYKPDNIHGDAAWASDKELKEAGYLGNGLKLGETLSGKSICLPEKFETHIVTFAGTGGGKTTGAAIVAGLSWKHSLLGLDSTGEFLATVADYRRKFGRVYQINHTGHFMEFAKNIPRARVNPMGQHRLNPKRSDFAARSRKVAEGFVRQIINGEQVYWYSSATDLVQAIIMALVRHDPKNAHPGKVAEIIAGDVKDFARYIARSTDNAHIKNLFMRWTTTEDIKSLREVIENTRTETAFLLDEATQDVLKGSDITFADCKERVTTIIPVVPPNVTDGRFLNLMFASANAELLEWRAGKKERTLIMADEYASLGFRDGPNIFTTARKFNVQMWICLQDYVQLSKMHPADHESFINNAGIVQVMDASDLTGSLWVSEMSGDGETLSYSKTLGYRLDDATPHASESWSQISRKLILPHNVRLMKEQILLIKGLRPVKGKIKRYFETPLAKKAKPNPFYSKR